MAERWIVLLRGVNVGGNNRLPKAAFRAALEAAGGRDVATYIQSGNGIMTAAAPDAAAIRASIAAASGVDVPVCLLSATAFRAAMAALPWSAPEDGRLMHLFFLWEAPQAADLEALTVSRTGREAWVRIGDVIYLHTPDGFGRSNLAEVATRRLKATARNWRSVQAIAALI